MSRAEALLVAIRGLEDREEDVEEITMEEESVE